MPSQRGLKLLLSVLGFPAGAGVVAHTLSGHYKSLMNFDGTFFLVKATEELYDSGIPKVPEDVQRAVEWMLERQRTEQIGKAKGASSTSTQTPRPRSASENLTTQEVEETEIFNEDDKEKKYWCRYFDYSGGKDNVIMQYDPFCTLYNVFETKDLTPQLQQASTGSVTQTQNRKQLTIKLSDFQNRTGDLEKKRLKSNSEFKLGGFYILKLDKNKIPQANSTFTIEITKPGRDKWNSERTYQPKISAVKIQAQLTGDPTDSVQFTFSNSLPSSRLIVKKVEDTATKVDSSADSSVSLAPSSNPSDSEEASYYFKHANNTNGEKLHIEHAWSFGNKSQTSGSVASPVSSSLSNETFDLSTLDKEPLKNFGTNGSQTPHKASQEKKHYLFRSVSDFWKYKVGDRVDLYKLPKSKDVQKSPAGQEAKVGTFEIVAGALVNLSRSFIRCVNKEQYDNKEFKSNLRAEESLIDFAWDARKDYCNKDGAPPVVLILLGL